MEQDTSNASRVVNSIMESRSNLRCRHRDLPREVRFSIMGPYCKKKDESSTWILSRRPTVTLLLRGIIEQLMTSSSDCNRSFQRWVRLSRGTEPVTICVDGLKQSKHSLSTIQPNHLRHHVCTYIEICFIHFYILQGNYCLKSSARCASSAQIQSPPGSASQSRSA